MISEINIYSDGTLISLNENKCLVPTASGTWAVLIDIYNWLSVESYKILPDECRFHNLKVSFVVRSAGKEERFPIPISHLFNMGRTIQAIAESGYKPIEVVVKEIESKIIEEYEK